MTWLETYVRALVRWRWATLLLVTLATIGIGSGMRKLRTEFDVERSLPANHPFVQIDRTIRRQFGGRNTTIIAIVPRTGDVWRPEVLEIVRDVTLAALRLPDVIAQNVVSLAAPSVRHVDASGGAISVDYLMRDIPTTPAEIAAVRAKVEGDPQLDGMLVTPDQKAAIVIVDFWEGATAHQLAERVMSLAAPYADRPIDMYFAGEPIISLTDVAQTYEITHLRIPATFIVTALMLLVSFRSLQGMFIPMLTATLSTVWAFGIMGHTGIVIDGWNGAVPILLIAVAAAHSAQMLKRYTEEVARGADNHAAVVTSTVKVGSVMIAAGLVAALGFASLALFGVPSIGGFGLSCAYGIGSAVLLEMTFIPALRAVLPRPKRLPPDGGFTGFMLDVLERGILRDRGRPVLLGAFAALAVTMIGIVHLRTFGPTREYMPPGSLPRNHLEAIEKHFPGTVTMTFLYEGEPGAMKSVAVLQHMSALQAELQKDPLVWRTASLADLVKILHRTFNSDAPDPYRIPDDQELVSQLMFLGESPAFERFTDRAQSKSILIAYLRDDDSARVGPFLRRMEAWLAAHPVQGAHVLAAGGAGPTVLAVNEHTTWGKLLNMVAVLTTIFIVASLMLRSPLAGLYVVIPLALTVLELFGVLGWTGLKLDMGTASIIAMAAGVGADYSIYFLYRFREERRNATSDAAALRAALQTSGRAVLFVAASIGAGFSVMGFSNFLGLRIFGMLMPAAMVLSCMASLTVMPVMALRRRPAFLFGKTAPDVAPALEPVAAR